MQKKLTIQEEEIVSLHCRHTQELEQLSQRFQMELAAHEKSAIDRLDSILNSLEEVVWSFSVESFQLLYVSPAVEQIYGYSTLAFFKNPKLWLEKVHPEDQGMVKQSLQQLLQTGKNQTLEYRIIRPDGSIRWLQNQEYGVYSDVGRVVRIDGLTRDITDRKESEAQLYLMKRAIAAASNGIVITKGEQEDNPVIYLNPAVEKATGYQAAEMLGQNLRFLHGTDIKQPELAILRQAIKAGQECNVVLRNYRKDGSLFWNELFIAPVQDDQGQVTHFIGIQNDITEQKKAETELRQSEFNLRAIVHTMSDGLVITAQNGQILFANPAAEGIFGRSIEKLLGQQFGLPYVLNQRVELSIRHPQRLIPVEFTVVELVWQNQPAYLISLRDLTERQEAELALHKKEEQFRLIFECASTGMAIASPAGDLIHVNQAFCDMLGYLETELIGINFQRITHPDDLAMSREMIRNLLNRELDEARLEKRYLTKGGHVVHAILQMSLLWDEEGMPSQFIIQVVDISDLKRTEAALRDSEAFLRSIYDGIEEAIFVVDVLENGVFRYAGVNPAHAKLTGIASETIRGKTLGQALPLGVALKVQQHYQACLEAQERITYEDCLPFEERDVWWATNLTPIRNEAGEIYRIIGTSVDVTQRKVAEEQTRYMALYDPLTDLPNRMLFLDRLRHAIQRSQRRDGFLFAVLFIDLDRFKVVNDSLGHAIGDNLLTAFARRIESCLRPCDTLARLGGDEFTILLEELKDIQDAIKIAKRINTLLRNSFNLEGYEVFTNASIGIALGTPNHHNPEDLVREADTAMYRAKALGKACYAVFDADMHKRALTRLQLENDLRRAVDRQELEVYYQPIVFLETGQLAGFEALIRWFQPQQGFIPPDHFIPLAEETGLILEIGQFVLRQACRQTYLWQHLHGNALPLQISVNLSSRQLSDPYLVEKILGILAETGLESQYLRLEITESLLMENPDSAAFTLQQLNTHQIQLAMDDFGTGYSSLSYLRQFPVHTIKIDRSFIQQLGTAEEDLEIVRAIVALAHNLGRTLVAEGIETLGQLEQLRTLGCELGQGFLFARALDLKAATALVVQLSGQPAPWQNYCTVKGNRAVG